MDGGIAVLDYGIGNLGSAHKALLHLGADARLVSDPDDAVGAAGVVLPGVGAFGRCAQALRKTGLDAAVGDALARGVPFLGICVGFQLLYEGSEESPGEPGLAVLGGTVRALPPGVKRPQMQWNQLVLRGGNGSGLLAGMPPEPWVYFVHSFAPEMSDDVVATCDYGGEVVAAAERGPVWGAQFHPEKSGSVGLAILANFVAVCRDGPRRRVSRIMELFPAIDLHDRGAVRLVQGDFGRVRGYGDPVALARSYVDGGARWIHVVDLDAARTGEPVNRDVVLQIAAAVDVEVQAGGGVRGTADAAALLDHGVQRVVLGTAALETPELVESLAERYPGRVAVGLDHRGAGAELAVRGWERPSGVTLRAAVDRLAPVGLGAVVVTAIDRDGMLGGPDLVGLARLRST